MRIKSSLILAVALVCSCAMAADGAASKKSGAKGRLPDFVGAESPQIGTNLPPLPPGFLPAPQAPATTPVPSVIRIAKDPLLTPAGKTDSPSFLTQVAAEPVLQLQDSKASASKPATVAEKPAEKAPEKALEPAKVVAERAKPEKVAEAKPEKPAPEPDVAKAPSTAVKPVKVVARAKKLAAKPAQLAKSKAAPVAQTLASIMSEPPASEAVVTPIPDSSALAQAPLDAPVRSAVATVPAEVVADLPKSQEPVAAAHTATPAMQASAPIKAEVLAQPEPVTASAATPEVNAEAGKSLPPAQSKPEVIAAQLNPVAQIPVAAPVLPSAPEPAAQAVSTAETAKPQEIPTPAEALARAPQSVATSAEPKVIVIRVEVPVAQPPEAVPQDPVRVSTESLVKKGYLGSSLGSAVRIDANGRVIR